MNNLNNNFNNLQKKINNELDELKTLGYVKKAKEINARLLESKNLKGHFDHASNLVAAGKIDSELFSCVDETSKLRKHLLYQSNLPIHFTGDLESDFVYVGLNPRPGDLEYKDELIYYKKNLFFDRPIHDFKDYVDFAKDFAKCKTNFHYKGKKHVPKNKFDGKQLVFFAGFNGMSFEDSIYSCDELVKLRSNRLQMELIPYPSLAFDFENYKKELCTYIDELFEIINVKKRKYVFFSGKVLNLLKSFEKESYKIVNKESCDNSAILKNKLKFPIIEYKDYKCKIGILQSFPNQALQGEKLYNYGKWCREEYDRIIHQ